MAKLLIDKKITGLESSWELYKGSRVREHIMEKCGAFYRPDKREADNAYHLKGFASLETRDIWIRYNSKEDSEIEASLELIELGINNREAIDALVLVDTSLGGNTDIINTADLFTGSSLENITSTDNKIILLLRFTSQEYNPVTESTRDTGESATLYVQRRTNENEDWITLGTISIPSLPYESTSYTLVDVSSLIPGGLSQIRCYAVGQISGTTTSSLQFATVIKTKLEVELATLWWVPVVATDVLNLQYYIRGAVAKTLHISISGEGGSGVRNISLALGTSVYSESPRTIQISDSVSDVVKVLTHGVHNVEAYVKVDGSNTESEHLYSQILVVDPSSASTNILFMLNNVLDTVDNYTLSTIFQYGIYNPNALTTRLTFALKDYSGTTTYLTSTEEVRNGNQGTYDNMFEIDSLESSIDTYLHVYDDNDNELITPVRIRVDNSENFAPTAGAAFVLNPKSRSNNEVAPNTIINSTNGEIVPATFTNFGFATDGWISDENGVKILRVPSGSSLNIDYEAFSQFMGTGNQTASLTMEFDVRTRNSTNENTPVLKVCSYQNGLPLGFEMKPMEAVFMTAALLTRRDQDIMFQEDTRTHITANIVYNLGNFGVNYIRLFVNGVINREMIYEVNDTFVSYVDGVKTSLGIRIGSPDADIDIYGIRIIKGSLSSSNVRQDYMASMSTTLEKLKFRDANDILNDTDTISYSKTFDKYSTILWTGELPYYLNSVKQIGDVKIRIVNREYNESTGKWVCTIDKSHSGEMKNVQLKGQGTSSMGYYKWNGQFKTSYEDNNSNEVATNWVDENGLEHGAVYLLTDDSPAATKLVWKINWASSQQSHKLGSCSLYTDLWRRVVGGNSITLYKDANDNYPYANVRVSVILKPFLLFVRETEEDDPVFYGLVTFGPGKADKPTFGYDGVFGKKGTYKDLCMIEGSDNGRPLTEHRVPWMLDEVTYDEDAEAYYYNKEKSWGFDLGNQDMINQYFVPAFNFIFLHNTNIAPFNGTYEQLIQQQLDIEKQYWVTTDSEQGTRYNLYRWDFITESWVNASTTKTNGEYDILNLSEQLNFTPLGTNWETINQNFISARIAEFRAHIGDYFDTNDLLYTNCFCKFIGASDNRCKNTYIYCDPITHKLGFMQDDLDTIFSTDNVGRKNKPYYVEEHDLDGNGLNYWNGTSNVLYNTLEQAMPDEIIGTMYTMLLAMKELGNGSLLGCLEKYYFAVQRYIPAVAYNEAARLLYEEASLIYGTRYTNATNPITQSLGDLLQGEMLWIKRRIIYMSSFASFGEFNSRDGIGGDGALIFRSILDTEGNAPQYNLTLTPALWLYPSVAVGTTPYYGRDRIPAGTLYSISNLSADGNTNIYIRGINYYKSIGLFGGVSLGEAFGLSGERLVEFLAQASEGMIQFRPVSMTTSARMIREFRVVGASSLVGELDLSMLTKAEIIDLRGTSLSGIILPLTSTLREVYLPDTITSLAILNMPNLQILLMNNPQNLTSLTIGNNVNPSIDIIAIFLQLRTNGILLAYLELRNIQWSGVSVNIVEYISDITDAYIAGSILNITGQLTFEMKRKLIQKFGDIDNLNNQVYMTYTMRNITGFVIYGTPYMSQLGTYQLELQTNPSNGNNVKNIQWLLSSQSCATINSKTGIVTVSSVGTELAAPEATVTVNMTLTDDSVITQTKLVRFYAHTPKLGDIVFADGSISDLNDPTKTAIGVIFYIDNYFKLMISTKDIITTCWGLYNGNGGYQGVTLSDTSTAYDVANLNNINANGTDYATDAKYLQDGLFKSFDVNSAAGDIGPRRLNTGVWANFDLHFSPLGYNEGDYVPAGMINTAAIIKHRNKILLDSNINLDIPAASNLGTEWLILNNLISEVVLENGSTANELYFPAASYCYAYEPTVKPGETLNPKFKAHRWWLPSEGELARVAFYKLHGYNSDSEDEYAIFANAYELGVFTLLTAGSNLYTWSSTEHSATNAWYLRFLDGYLGAGYGAGYTYKYYSNFVRAVCAC